MSAGKMFYVFKETLGKNTAVDIRPQVGQEAVIHNIHATGEVSIQVVDNSTSGNIVLIEEIYPDEIREPLSGISFHCSNNIYYKVQNISDGPISVFADGVITRVE